MPKPAQRLSSERKFLAASSRLDDYQRIMMAIVREDIPCLQAIIRRAFRNHVSLKEILHRLGNAMDRAYHSRLYTDDDFDIARLCMRLGGPKLVYALHQYTNIPSLRTIQRHSIRIQIRPSLGTISSIEVGANIRSVTQFVTARAARGHSFSLDETALEERPRYYPESHSLGGLCCEHSWRVDARITCLESILIISEKLKENVVHWGKEATVGAVSPFSRDSYSPMPILVSPTCKKESPEKMVDTYKIVLQEWDVVAPRLGSIWEFGSDGDPSRRASFHPFLMQHTLRPSDPLYGELARLPLLNLQTGPQNITMDFDYKHLFKRIMHLLRQEHGIMIGDCLITPDILVRHLRRLSGMDAFKVYALMNPHDKQNVPSAVQLLCSVVAVSKLPTDGLNPSEQKICAALTVLGSWIASIVEPFIDPSMSLTQQLESLSTAGHVMLALFSFNRSSFIPGAQYHDIAAMVKNAFFCVAKQKILDSDGEFFLSQLGDDRLENLFGRVRTLIHNIRNVDLMQLTDHIGSASEVDAVMMRHPSWDAADRRRSISGSVSVDHISPACWTGDVHVARVSLFTSWTVG
ncbi:hypothetical protein BOTBODRAFT_121543, partial [Botryobasidium botryosum FD-172 SS1]